MKAYLNVLYEEGSRKEIFEWLCKVDAENDRLRKFIYSTGVTGSELEDYLGILS